MRIKRKERKRVFVIACVWVSEWICLCMYTHAHTNPLCVCMCVHAHTSARHTSARLMYVLPLPPISTQYVETPVAPNMCLYPSLPLHLFSLHVHSTINLPLALPLSALSFKLSLYLNLSFSISNSLSLSLLNSLPCSALLSLSLSLFLSLSGTQHLAKRPPVVGTGIDYLWGCYLLHHKYAWPINVYLQRHTFLCHRTYNLETFFVIKTKTTTIGSVAE